MAENTDKALVIHQSQQVGATVLADKLYPKEVIDVMTQVLNGSYKGTNPEGHIDQLLGDFYANIPDKKKWVLEIGNAVRTLGCLDCVYARLNLECLLEPHEGDKITIRYDRQRLLPGENHGIGCGCRACLHKSMYNGISGPAPQPAALPTAASSALPAAPTPPTPKPRDPDLYDGTRELLKNAPDPSAAYERRFMGTSALANDGIKNQAALKAALEANKSAGSPPPSRAPRDNSPVQILSRDEQKVAEEQIGKQLTPLEQEKQTKTLSPQEQRDKNDRIARARTGDFSVKDEKGPDGEEVIAYPEDAEALAELEADFYAHEAVVKAEPPRPSIDPERKIEILESLKQMGYEAVDTREKAWQRLEKLLRRKTPEQSLIGRLAYLIIFEAFRASGDPQAGISSRRLLGTIAPRRALPPGFGQ